MTTASLSTGGLAHLHDVQSLLRIVGTWGRRNS